MSPDRHHPLSGEQISEVRAHWRDFQARRGDPLRHLLALNELLPGRAVAKLLKRRDAGPAAEGDLTDDQIRGLAAAGETPVPMYFAWALRARDGYVALGADPDELATNPPMPGWMTGHALRLGEEMRWLLLDREARILDKEGILNHEAVIDRVVGAIAAAHPGHAHTATSESVP